MPAQTSWWVGSCLCQLQIRNAFLIRTFSVCSLGQIWFPRHCRVGWWLSLTDFSGVCSLLPGKSLCQPISGKGCPTALGPSCPQRWLCVSRGLCPIAHSKGCPKKAQQVLSFPRVQVTAILVVPEWCPGRAHSWLWHMCGEWMNECDRPWISLTTTDGAQ